MYLPEDRPEDLREEEHVQEMSAAGYIMLALLGGSSVYFLTSRKKARVAGAVGGAAVAVVAVAAFRPGGWLRPQKEMAGLPLFLKTSL